jgi:chaperone BCS1
LLQKIELYRRFFPQATDLEGRQFVESHFAETMAEFQGLLLGLEQGESPESVTSDHGVLV